MAARRKNTLVPALQKKLGEYAWFNKNSKNKTHPVGQKKPNILGLYDMSGNVQEWVNDWMLDYTSERQENPVGPIKGWGRVIRDGSWGYTADNCETAHRWRENSDYYNDKIGFRLVAPVR